MSAVDATCAQSATAAKRSSLRVKNTLIDAARPKAFPNVEFHLRKLNRFFIHESIDTVFPACAEYVKGEEKQAVPGIPKRKVAVCALFTFQESVGVLEAATDEELAAEREAFLKAVTTSPAICSDAAVSSGASQMVGTPGKVVDDEDVGSGTGGISGGNSEDGCSKTGSPTARHEKAISGLVGYRPEAVIWKDHSREVFFDFCTSVHAALTAKAGSTEITANGSPLTFFLDWPDPATGLPMNTRRGPSSFTDSDAIEQMFPFDSVLVAGAGGGCRMMKHPTFDLCVYPACAILAFPEDQVDVVKEVLHSLVE